MKKVIAKVIAEHETTLTEEQLLELIEIPADTAMGDFALPCFSMAKLLRKAPKMIADEWKEKLEIPAKEYGIERIDSVNGYLNFHVNKAVYVKNMLEQLQKPDFGVEKIGQGKTVCMDYSSPNIAKNFHVGHLRTTVIGNALHHIYKCLGYHVVRINHLGDWGTQFGKLIVAYRKWSSREQVEEDGIEELLRIYVKFNEEAKDCPELNDEARNWFAKMEQGNEEAIAIWKWFKEISLKEFQRIYQLLGIEFDSYTGESFYMDKVPALVEELQKKGLLQESQGASIIDLSEYDMAPCLITKSDGSSIYHSRDIAAVLYRKQTYDFDKCIYVTGLEQTLHFKQVFKAVELMGDECYKNLIHVPYGLVSLKGAKLSTRDGNIIYAEDILKEAISRSLEMIKQKNPSLENKETVAQMVGVGAVVFHDLFHQRIKNIDFSWEDVLNFEGTTGPYVQYTYARAKSILRKSGIEVDGQSVEAALLTADSSYTLLKRLTEYPMAVAEAAERNEPSVIARYLISIASLFNKFYHDCNILNEEAQVKIARLCLVDMTQKIIKNGCRLLGIECPERM